MPSQMRKDSFDVVYVHVGVLGNESTKRSAGPVWPKVGCVSLFSQRRVIHAKINHAQVGQEAEQALQYAQQRACGCTGVFELGLRLQALVCGHSPCFRNKAAIKKPFGTLSPGNDMFVAGVLMNSYSG